MASARDKMNSDTGHRLPSAVTHGAGVAGLFGLILWLLLARRNAWSGPDFALVAVVACALPTVIWSIWRDKVHLKPSTGLNWQRRPNVDPLLPLVATKLLGLWFSWALIAAAYCLFRWYWRDPFIFAMQTFAEMMPALFLSSIGYVHVTTRHMELPKDGAWHFGAFICGVDGWSGPCVAEHLRAWAVKGFFLAFMLSILPGAYARVVSRPADELLASPFAFSSWLISLMFVIDIVFGTMGYVLTLRPLDAHIRSTQPRLAGWVAALICYPPFVLMGEGRIFDSRYATFGEENWVHWLPNAAWLQMVWGSLLVMLTGIYAWSTLVFGPRFSNLTHRGIITHGPYAVTKHPAYVAKVLFWWLSVLPFCVTTGKPSDMIRNCAAMAGISGIYYWRAKTEEAHLSDDPIYRAYASWIAHHGLFARIKNWGRRWAAPKNTRA